MNCKALLIITILFFCINALAKDDHAQPVTRPLSKLAAESEVRGESERRTGVYTQVHEDWSTESTKASLADNGATPPKSMGNDQEVLQTVYCPLPSQLIKNGLFWGTPTGNWKSYTESFNQQILSFVGAQWVGVNVGKMICIYKGNLSLSFPIILQNDTLAQIPQGNLWGVDIGGYRSCHSTSVLDCPFIVKTEKMNIQDVYKSLDFFKGKPNPVTQGGV
jgi:hypothetical protein